MRCRACGCRWLRRFSRGGAAAGRRAKQSTFPAACWPPMRLPGSSCPCSLGFQGDEHLVTAYALPTLKTALQVPGGPALPAAPWRDPSMHAGLQVAIDTRSACAFHPCRRWRACGWRRGRSWRGSSSPPLPTCWLPASWSSSACWRGRRRWAGALLLVLSGCILLRRHGHAAAPPQLHSLPDVMPACLPLTTGTDNGGAAGATPPHLRLAGPRAPGHRPTLRRCGRRCAAAAGE